MGKSVLEYFNGNELAANVWQSKYQLKDENGKAVEETPDDMHRRLAKEFAVIELEESRELSTTEWNSLSHYGRHRNPLTEDSIYELFKDFKYIIPQGSIMQMLGNPYKIGSLSNCFVIGQPEDSYSGIMRKDEEQVQLMKRRGGVGLDLSTLRPRHTKVNNAAITSSGAASFANRFSNSTREVAQDGRRGALMLTMRVEHPDIEEFITMKEDTSKITGANISVMITDEFMKAVEEDGDFMLKFPVGDYTITIPDQEYNEVYTGQNNSMFKKVKARQIWDKIVKSAHSSAEPGVMFINNHWNLSPDSVYPHFKGVTTNPCGEIFMGEYDACRLISINLFSFVENPFTIESTFNTDKFYKVAYEQQILADDLVTLELRAIDKITYHIAHSRGDNTVEQLLWAKIQDIAYRGRRTGSGFTGLGDAIAAMNVKYDDSIPLVTLIMQTKMRAELDAIIDMAIIRGAFPEWNKELEAVSGLLSDHTDKNIPFYENLAINFPEQYARMMQYGRRNISWSTAAPTGTVSILTETTSGIEPLFAPYYTRRKKINANDTESRVDFVEHGDKFQEFYVFHPKLLHWYEVSQRASGIENPFPLTKTGPIIIDAIIQGSPWYGSTANDISPEKRIQIQAVVQRYTTHSISSTINLPKNTTPEVISNIYLNAWKKDLKGVTVYRDGSRSGILVSNKEDEVEFKVHDAPKRGKELEANLHFATARGINFIIIIGLKDGKPYEFFAFTDETRMNKVIKGKTTKVKRGVYSFTAYDKEDNRRYFVENIITEMDIEQKATTLYGSMLLRHGTPITHLIKTMKKVSDNISSLTSAIIRVLSLYIPDGADSAEKCSNCGAELVFENGCVTCKHCGKHERQCG